MSVNVNSFQIYYKYLFPKNDSTIRASEISYSGMMRVIEDSRLHEYIQVLVVYRKLNEVVACTKVNSRNASFT